MAEGVLARGRYRVLSELGRGGAGTVFLVEDVSLGRRCALKVYHRRGRGERVRLMSEARSAARFEHLGVVRVFDVDETLGAIAMELLPGSIRAEHRRGGLAAARVASWLRSVAEVLEHIHAAGVVHRDLKPSNLLLRGDDRVVLTDFGLACEVGAVPSAAEAGEGTLAYMPLEQRAGAAASPSMDLHALGVAARELLAAVAGPLPAQLLALAADCERARPEDRPTAAEVRAALDSFPRPAR
jgi:serine/threonine-protein kinase